MSKLLVTDFLLVGLLLLYLSRFELHSDCLWESHVVLEDGEVVPYGELPLLSHLTTGHKTPRRQMYITDVVLINGKDYTHYNADS